MKPPEDNLLDVFKGSEDKPFVITGGGNVIVNVGRLNTELREIRNYAKLIVENQAEPPAGQKKGEV